MLNATAQLALMRLSTASLPIGGYSYSQGLESAVAEGLVLDEEQLAQWLRSGLANFARNDALFWTLAFQACKEGAWADAVKVNQRFWASRDSQESRSETVQMGWSLRAIILAMAWGDDLARQWLAAQPRVVYPFAHAFACASQGIHVDAGVLGFCYNYVESQITAAQKLLPIGQMAGQRLLSRLAAPMSQIAQDILNVAEQGEAALHTATPLLSVLSARHEHQYSRLFRS